MHPTLDEQSVTPDAARPALGSRLERSATWLSMACAVHCLVTPVASALVPLLGSPLGRSMGHGTDVLLTTLVVVGAAVSALMGWRRHRDARVTGALFAAILLYLFGHALEDVVGVGEAWAIASALALGAASFVSARKQQACVTSRCAHSR